MRAVADIGSIRPETGVVGELDEPGGQIVVLHWRAQRGSGLEVEVDPVRRGNRRENGGEQPNGECELENAHLPLLSGQRVRISRRRGDDAGGCSFRVSPEFRVRRSKFRVAP
jgi:hypothetical protein